MSLVNQLNLIVFKKKSDKTIFGRQLYIIIFAKHVVKQNLPLLNQFPNNIYESTIYMTCH